MTTRNFELGRPARRAPIVDVFARRRATERCYNGDIRIFFSTMLELSLIVIGAVIYEASFVYHTHGIVFVIGTTLALAGGLAFAEDWLGL